MINYNFIKCLQHQMFGIFLIFNCAYFVTVALNVTPPRRVAVIGGGAAGFFSAIECARSLREKNMKSDLIVFEAGENILSKVLISGGGRCNVMHDPNKGSDTIAKGYPRGSRELLGPFNKKFGPWDTLSWFSEKGLDLKVEADGRMFPTTDKSSSVIEVLTNAAKKEGVKIRTHSKIVAIKVSKEGTFTLQISSKNSRESKDIVYDEDYDRLIIATGSSRTGYNLVKELGHSLNEPMPSLFSFKIQDKELHDLAGISCPCTKVKVVLPNDFSVKAFASNMAPSALQASLTQKGPMSITHQGLTGPAVLRLSAFAAKVLFSLDYKCSIEISWVGELTVSQVTEILSMEKRRHPQRSIGKGFPGLDGDQLAILKGEDSGLGAPLFYEEDEMQKSKATEEEYVIKRRLWLYILRRVGINLETKWASIDSSLLSSLAKELCSSLMKVEGRGQYRDEFVTCGGVPLKEIKMEHMESKVLPGLYLAGEILDIDGVTGGYNFQSAWTTGFIAGQSCARSFGE